MIFGLLAVLAAQTFPASDVRPSGFYVAGIQQGMTLADYNALIANGSYRSEPLGPDRYFATINGQSVAVTFCQGRVVGALANYRSSDWMQAMKTLEAVGFKWGAPLIFLDDNAGKLRTDMMTFSLITPKGYTYYVAPMIKGATLGERDLPTFQLNFEALNHAC